MSLPPPLAKLARTMAEALGPLGVGPDAVAAVARELPLDRHDPHRPTVALAALLTAIDDCRPAPGNGQGGETGQAFRRFFELHRAQQRPLDPRRVLLARLIRLARAADTPAARPPGRGPVPIPNPDGLRFAPDAGAVRNLAASAARLGLTPPQLVTAVAALLCAADRADPIPRHERFETRLRFAANLTARLLQPATPDHRNLRERLAGDGLQALESIA